MSFLNLLWIYIINEKWKQYKLSKTNKEQRREVMYKKLMTCLESVQKKIDFKPEVALILGSGLGDFADNRNVVAKFVNGKSVPRDKDGDETAIFGGNQ